MKLSGIAIDQSIVRDIFGDHRASTYESISANIIAADDGSIGTNGGSLFDQSGLEFVLAGYLTPGVNNIGESAGGTAEDIILQGYSLKDRDTVFNLDIVPYLYPFANKDILPNNTVLANSHLGHDVAKVP